MAIRSLCDLRVALISLSALICSAPALSADLTIEIGTKTTLTTEQLLARPDVKTIDVPDDISYHRQMTYRAVPLRTLPGVSTLRPDQDLQITGTDGFVTNLPASLVLGSGNKGAVAWLAIEPTGKPWPQTSDGNSIGAFYVVWTNPAASNISSEQWPYKVGSLRAVSALAARWPQIEPGTDVPASSPVRKGQTVVATQCMVCHKINGAGDASMGPDLVLPHGPTEYFQPWALRQYIRDPRSIRAWADMKMPGFSQTQISDKDLDAVIAYLSYMSTKRK